MTWCSLGDVHNQVGVGQDRAHAARGFTSDGFRCGLKVGRQHAYAQPGKLAWERSLFIAAYVVAALGVALLETSCGIREPPAWRGSGPPYS